jgi:hypothetical protein
MELLLIDEVLAVGDIAFQMKCLERLEELKASGTTILFVSHSEMNVRQIADRCLLLFEGECLGVGETDAMFRRYYEATGFLDRNLKPMGIAPEMPADFDSSGMLAQLMMEGQSGEETVLVSSESPIRIRGGVGPVQERSRLVIQFWTPSGLLMASAEASLAAFGGRDWVFEIPYLGLAAGHYRVAAGVRDDRGWMGYQRKIFDLAVREEGLDSERGLFRLDAKLTPSQ